jgi:hypothetical protein
MALVTFSIVSVGSGDREDIHCRTSYCTRNNAKYNNIQNVEDHLGYWYVVRSAPCPYPVSVSFRGGVPWDFPPLRTSFPPPLNAVKIIQIPTLTTDSPA